MTTGEIIALAVAVLSGIVSIITILTYRHNRTKQTRAEGEQDGAKRVEVAASLDNIKLQNEMLLSGNREICTKIDDQNTRLVRLEQTVDNAKLSEIPAQLAEIKASAKSAHNRLDRLEKK